MTGATHCQRTCKRKILALGPGQKNEREPRRRSPSFKTDAITDGTPRPLKRVQQKPKVKVMEVVEVEKAVEALEIVEVVERADVAVEAEAEVGAMKVVVEV